MILANGKAPEIQSERPRCRVAEGPRLCEGVGWMVNKQAGKTTLSCWNKPVAKFNVVVRSMPLHVLVKNRIHETQNTVPRQFACSNRVDKTCSTYTISEDTSFFTNELKNFLL